MKRVGISLDWVRRWAPVLVATASALTFLYYAAAWFAESHPRWKRHIRLLWLSLCLWLGAGIALADLTVAEMFPPKLVNWIEATGLLVVIFSFSAFGVAWCGRIRPEKLNPGRRRLLGTLRAAVVAAPAAMTGYGVFLERHRVRLAEIPLAMPGLPPALNGLRIVQLSDMHRSAFYSRADLDRAVAMANEARPHLIVVTGDLITRRGDPLDDCLNSLSRLRAEAGVFGCLGNHEVYAACQNYATAEGRKRGIRFLRQESQVLEFGGARLNLCGVDYQRLSSPYLVGAEAMVRPDAFNLLLSHNPDVFPVAQKQGFHLTLSGHTHGGQINVEILSENLNLARFFTPYVLGEYRKENSVAYVTPGLGTVGVPIRLGVPPEVTLIRLCAS